MKTKIAFLSLSCGILIFVLIFVWQIFFTVYPGINMKPLYIADAIFLLFYITIFSMSLIKYKSANKILLYIVVPFGVGCIIKIFLSIYYFIFYGSNMFLHPRSILYFYFFSGFWSVGVFGGLIDLLITSNCRQSDDSSTANKKDD